MRLLPAAHRHPRSRSLRHHPPWSLLSEPAPPPVAAEPETPLDPAIRTGKLKNGMTFYVMGHQKPEQRAALWLAVNAGSVQEDDDQRGLAHFVEHMAFNGTKRFPKQAIVNYIEKIGMRFGADVNAYTSFDETVYMLTVPTDDRSSCTRARHPAGLGGRCHVRAAARSRRSAASCSRSGGSAAGRTRASTTSSAPVMFQGSKYAERLPIGLPEIIKKAPREALVRYYKDWYRPEHMAVIAVGDFDPEAMEKRDRVAVRRTCRREGAKRPREAVPIPHDHPTAGVDRDRSGDAVLAGARDRQDGSSRRADEERLPAAESSRTCITRC